MPVTTYSIQLRQGTKDDFAKVQFS